MFAKSIFIIMPILFARPPVQVLDFILYFVQFLKFSVY